MFHYLMASYLMSDVAHMHGICWLPLKDSLWVLTLVLLIYWFTYAKKSRCSNHRAQNNGNLHRKRLDSTGKGACACARHSAFVPRCVVDFQKGERWACPTLFQLWCNSRRDRQINMDYSICQALKQFPCHDEALIIYDICCQWLKHFHEHVSKSDYLDLSDSLEITSAVRKWHLATHIPECFPQFTLNFIEGAAEVEGEIWETCGLA